MSDKTYSNEAGPNMEPNLTGRYIGVNCPDCLKPIEVKEFPNRVFVVSCGTGCRVQPRIATALKATLNAATIHTPFSFPYYIPEKDWREMYPDIPYPF